MHDDRVGFFNAVPRKDILQAAMGITKEYQERAGSKVLSIDPLSKTGHPGNPRPSFKRCWVEDLSVIICNLPPPDRGDMYRESGLGCHKEFPMRVAYRLAR